MMVNDRSMGRRKRQPDTRRRAAVAMARVRDCALLAILFLQIVSAVPVTPRRRSHSRLLQNIFDHTKKEVKKGVPPKGSQSKGDTLMPSISPAPSALPQSKKSKGSKGLYSTKSPAPSSVASSKKPKGSKGMHSIKSPAPSSLSQSKKSKGSKHPYSTKSPAPTSLSQSKKPKGSKARYSTKSPVPTFLNSRKHPTSKSSKDGDTMAPASPTASRAPSGSMKNSASKKSGKGQSKGSWSKSAPETKSPAPSSSSSKSKGKGKGKGGSPSKDGCGKGKGKGGSKGSKGCSSPAPSASKSKNAKTVMPTAELVPSASSKPTPARPTTPDTFVPTPNVLPSLAPIQQPVVATSEPTAGPSSELAPASSPTALPAPSAVPEPTAPPLPTSQPVVTSPTMVASPTLVPAPTMASSPTAAVTSSPTTAGGIPVDATPFSAIYDGVSADPSQAYCDAASNVTIGYLTTSFEDFFNANPFVDLQSVQIEATGCAGDPPQISYTATAVFASSSDAGSIPQTADLDTLLEVSFEQPMVTELTTELAALPADNPFAQTSGVSYAATAAATARTQAQYASDGTAAQDQMTLGFAASVCALALAGTALRRATTARRRRTAVGASEGDRTRPRWPGWESLPETDAEWCR